MVRPAIPTRKLTEGKGSVHGAPLLAAVARSGTVGFYEVTVAQFCRKAGIGTGMLNAFIAPPIPFSHVFGGNVHPVPFPWHPAAQNMYPSMPVVVPAPAGARSSTKLAAVF